MSDPLQEFRAAMLAALAYAPEVIEPGRLQRFPTKDRRGDDAGWCLMFADQLGGVFGCNRQGIHSHWSAVSRERMSASDRQAFDRRVTDAKAAREREQRQRWAENSRRIGKAWAECQALTPGDPVTLYLKRRGFGGVWPLSRVLKLHPRVTYWDGETTLGAFPAMVAPLIGPGGAMVALHRTYLTAAGCKADVPSPKKLSPTAGPSDGAAIPLFAPRDGCLGIAEGIETALGAWCGSAVPTVAAYSAGSLARYRWPAGLRRLVVFADNDDAGASAAATLWDRATRAALSCEVLTPSTPGEDWADVWQACGKVPLSVGRAE